ncbi:hypothetical protein [Streptomyces sp. NPDC057460]|uniref:hypothetical protein n=1 Tax=Streptomyces sp. NPDC057460 TaxID=3346141 RepID=UPI00368F5049
MSGPTSIDSLLRATDHDTFAVAERRRPVVSGDVPGAAVRGRGDGLEQRHTCGRPRGAWGEFDPVRLDR